MIQIDPAELPPAGGSQDIRAGDKWVTAEILPERYGLWFCLSARCEGKARLAIYVQAFIRYNRDIVHWFTSCYDCNQNMHAVEGEFR